MSPQRFFNHSHQHPLPIRMCEFEFEYASGRGVHEATLAYVVATHSNRAQFDAYIYSKRPEYGKSLVSKDMIKTHEHTVDVLPSIELMN